MAGVCQKHLKRESILTFEAHLHTVHTVLIYIISVKAYSSEENSYSYCMSKDSEKKQSRQTNL
jgi:hypothetical protein